MNKHDYAMFKAVLWTAILHGITRYSFFPPNANSRTAVFVQFFLTICKYARPPRPCLIIFRGGKGLLHKLCEQTNAINVPHLPTFLTQWAQVRFAS